MSTIKNNNDDGVTILWRGLLFAQVHLLEKNMGNSKDRERLIYLWPTHWLKLHKARYLSTPHLYLFCYQKKKKKNHQHVMRSLAGSQRIPQFMVLQFLRLQRHLVARRGRVFLSRCLKRWPSSCLTHTVHVWHGKAEVLEITAPEFLCAWATVLAKNKHSDRPTVEPVIWSGDALSNSF